MSPDFTPLYAQLTESYTRIAPSRWFPHGKTVDTFHRSPSDSLSLVIKAVRRAAAELTIADRLRSDAFHFLVINMHQMVTLPVLTNAMASRRSVRSDDEQDFRRPEQSMSAMYHQLREDVEHDVKLILTRANQISDDEISGRAVLQATSQVYGYLRTAASNVWG